MPTDHQQIEAGGREVRISSPDKLIFPEAGITKRALIDYYLALAEPALNQLRDRPTVLKRFPNGAAADPFFQKRIPDSAPDWLQTTTVTFPSGRTARELTPNDAAHLVWGVNLGVIDWNPWQVRAPELDHPDELRVDLDPTPEASWDDVRRVAVVCGEVLSDHGLTGYPKTSGSRGIHVYARVEAAARLLRDPPSGTGVGARGRAPRTGAGDEQVVEGGAPRRVRRLQPEHP